MFSGIVEAVGVVESSKETGDGVRLRIVAPQLLGDARIGESISVSGACMTVVEFASECFDVEVTHESLRCTTLGSLQPQSRVNLEKALKMSDRLGGHMVTGHVDTVGKLIEIVEEGFSKVMKFSLSSRWSQFFVKKGSVTVEGVSLTVADCGPVMPISSSQEGEFWFSVALIPHTMDVTTLGTMKIGQAVNIETDVIARYVVRLLGESYLENLNKERESVL